MVKYSCLIVDPDQGSRIRLKTAASALVEFDRVLQCNDLVDAAARRERGERYDVIFLSERLGHAELISFAQNGKRSHSDTDTAYVLLRVHGGEHDRAALASSMSGGIDGLLFEPFSVDSLREITELAARIKRERARAREMTAVELLIKEIIVQIDVVAELRRNGHEAGISERNLRDMCAVLPTLEGEVRDHYFSQVIAIMEGMKPPISGRLFYHGSSQRVKKKLEEKLNSQRGASGALRAKTS